MRKMSVRMVWGFALAALLVVALVGAAWNFTQESLKAAAFVAHTHEVMSGLGEAESQLFRMEASHRAFLVALDPRMAQQREAAIAEVERGLDDVAQSTADNAVQQERIAALKKLVAQRVQAMHELQALLSSGKTVSIDQRLQDGAGFRDLVRPLFAAMASEERRLLGLRQAVEIERARTVRLTFLALLLGLAILLPWVLWRLRRDSIARQAAEEAASTERRYDTLHARALTLYNAESDAQHTLDGTLALLAEGGLFPVSAMYLHDELSGTLRLQASRGVPADARSIVRIGEGPLGEAARLRQPVYLEHFEPATGMVIETGLARVRPAAMLSAPVAYQGKLLGVLALAAASKMAERERDFVERLCAQLGVALHNLEQLDGLNSLAASLRERSADVERKNQELEHATRMKTEFLANMSHELRTPLNAVIGFSEILRDGLAGTLTDEQHEFVGHVHSSGRHLLSLINDILDLSKVEAGQMSLHLEPELPADIVASSLVIVRQRAVERGLRLVDACEPALGPVRLDGRKVRQILSNLLSNAVKFTPEGGTVTLQVSKVTGAAVAAAAEGADTRLFAPPAGDHAHWLALQVTDTGIGMASAGLAQLFQPFMQIDSSLTREYEGTGLGLTMVQRLAQLHGGGLRVHSVPGQGSSFTVWLPWREVQREVQGEVRGVGTLPAPAEVPASAVVAPAPVPSAQDEAACVLLIDDDAHSVAVLRRQLEGQGLRVVAALDPQQGLLLAEQLRPQAIVLDVLMPSLDGWEVLSRLKELEATRHIPVVIVSITDEPGRGFALGASQVLLKPVEKDQLLAALKATGLQSPPPGARVLVVDDDPNAVTIIRKQLEAEGYAAVCAHGGQEALDIVRRNRPALIVLDLMMPQVSGFDVVEALGSHPDTADIPIIVLTAKLVTARDRELLRGRVQRLIEKSEFETRGLLAEIKRAMSRTPQAMDRARQLP